MNDRPSGPRPAVLLFATDRRVLLVLLAASLLLVATGIGGRDLWDPDEPRTAVITAGLLRDGRWAAPEQHGHPWLEKPPLYYWLASAASSALGGVSETSARIPANAAAVLTALVLFALGRSLFGRRCGGLAALVLLTTEDFLIEARWARPDMLLALLLTAAVLCLWHATQAGGAGWWAGFFLACGLGVLAKGPVGLLPIPGALLYLASTRRLRRLLQPDWIVSLPLLFVPAGLWMLAWSASTGERFPLGELLGRFAERVVSGLHHPRPAWHVLTTLPLALLPWIALLPATIAETWPRPGRPRDDRLAFVYSLLASDLLIFAASVEKRGVYLLPMVPLIALLIGRYWDVSLFDWDPPPARRLVSAGLWCWAAIVAAAAIVVWRRAGREAPDLVTAGSWLGIAGLMAFLPPALLLRRIGPGRAIGVFAAGAAATGLVIVHLVLPALDPLKSARPLAARVAEATGEAPIGIHPDPHAGLAWYLARPVTLLPDREALFRFLDPPGRGVGLVERTAWDLAQASAPDGTEVVLSGRVGHREFVLVRRTGDGAEVPRDAPADGAP
ncbi:MAG TPA: glycosyltransferase family 39 protein [Candidatus Polarisedimenticolia bacterium]|nr:glycosyltransferase family 39 protein [Candidatus Polarisedimenticolia bacterium]